MSTAELLGKTGAELGGAAAEHQRFEQDDREVIDSGRSKLIPEETFTRRDGQVRVLQTCKIPYVARDSGQPAVLAVAVDITERKQADQKRRRYEIQLAHAQKMEAIGTLAGGIAHDFNNILAAMIGYTELVQVCPALPSLEHDRLEHVLQAGRRARDLIRQVLTFSREVKTEPKPVEVHLIVEEVLKLLRSSLPASIRIRRDIDRAAGSVLADPVQLHQIMMNLGTNAMHAMAKNGGTLSIGLQAVTLTTASDPAVDHHPVRHHPVRHHLQSDGPYIRLTVSDSGCGMDEETRKRIFDPYFTTREEGTGLGLATTHSIVAELGGAITVESRPSKGSTFSIYLPRFRPALEKPARHKPAAPPGHGQRILLVDDEIAVLQMTMEMLDGLGYDLVKESSSRAALEIFLTDPDHFDLVITDLTMPGLNGLELAQALKEIRPQIPVILISGYEQASLRDKARTSGITAIVDKPFGKQALAETIAKVLG